MLAILCTLLAVSLSAAQPPKIVAYPGGCASCAPQSVSNLIIYPKPASQIENPNSATATTNWHAPYATLGGSVRWNVNESPHEWSTWSPTTDTCPFAAAPPANLKLLNLPPRYMWGWGATSGAAYSGVLGYCGEVALQSIGLYYGNWIHTNTVFLAGGSSTTLYTNYATKRGVQSPPLPGNTLLVGALQNFVATAAKLGMTATTYSGACGSGAAFLSSFVRPAIDAGQPVVMGLVDPTLNSGYSYDHIVNVVGYTPGAAGGVASLYYNTLMYLQTNALNASALLVPRAQCTRAGGYAAIGSEYCLPGAPNDCTGGGDPSGNVYAHAVTGNSAPGQFFAQLQVNHSNEPDVSPVDAWYYSGSVTRGAGFSKSPLNAPIAFSGQLNVFGLTVGASYSCVMFTDAARLSPVCDHLNAPWTKLWTFVATATVNTFSITAADFTSTTNSYFFRCMRTNATLTACPSSPPPPPAFCNGAAIGAFASVTPSTRAPSVPPPSGPAMTSGAHAAPLSAWVAAAATAAIVAAVLTAL